MRLAASVMRTRDALAAAKARGVILGDTGPANLKRHTQASGGVHCLQHPFDAPAEWLRFAGLESSRNGDSVE